MNLKFDPTWNYGLIGGTALALVALGIAWNTATGSITDLKSDLAKLTARAETRAAYYGPKIEALEKTNSVQDERFANMVTSLSEQRRVNNELLTQFGTMREDIAFMKARIVEQDRPLRRSR